MTHNRVCMRKTNFVIVAKGVIQLRAQLVNEELSMDVHTFLDRFYLSRIGIRFLMGQHIAQFYNPPSPDYVGLVCTNTNINELGIGRWTAEGRKLNMPLF